VKITLADAENKPPDSPKRTRKNKQTKKHTHKHNRNNTLKLVCTKPPVDTLQRKQNSAPNYISNISSTYLLLPSSSSSSSAASCSRFTTICEILQPSPSPHAKEATESFLSLANPSLDAQWL
jgi:hypothetical protein